MLQNVFAVYGYVCCMIPNTEYFIFVQLLVLLELWKLLLLLLLLSFFSVRNKTWTFFVFIQSLSVIQVVLPIREKEL